MNRAFAKPPEAEPASQHTGTTSVSGPGSFPLMVYFDGECPICRREINLMKLLDRKEQLRFVDFAHSSYEPEKHGFDQCDLGKVIHARLADGTTITGVEVFQAMWEAIGLGVLARVSRLPVINKLFVKAYAWFAKNRLRITGRT